MESPAPSVAAEYVAGHASTGQRPIIDHAKIQTGARLDGKYLIATSDPHISAEDAALGYKDLLETERGSATSSQTCC